MRGWRHCLALDLAAAPTFHADAGTADPTYNLLFFLLLLLLLLLGAAAAAVVVAFRLPTWSNVASRSGTSCLFWEHRRRRVGEFRLPAGAIPPTRCNTLLAKSEVEAEAEAEEQAETHRRRKTMGTGKRARGRCGAQKKSESTIHLPRRGATCYLAPPSPSARHGHRSLHVRTGGCAARVAISPPLCVLKHFEIVSM